MSDPQPSIRLTSQTVTGVVRKGATVLLLTLGAGYGVSGQQQPPNLPESFRFRTGVELINVTATVTDSRGRFVSGLQKDDFLVYEDGELQPVTYFSNERVPVSLGIALDTSGSMNGDKIVATRHALDRFLYDLLGRDDEIFLYQFNYTSQFSCRSGRPTGSGSAVHLAGSGLGVGPRCTTRWPRQYRWRNPGDTPRRRS